MTWLLWLWGKFKAVCVWFASRPVWAAIAAGAVMVGGMVLKIWASGRKIVKLEKADARAKLDKKLEPSRTAAAVEKERQAATDRKWIEAVERGKTAAQEQQDAEESSRKRADRWRK